MPTYSYACTTCEHRFDTVQAFTDPSLTECPECHGRLRKLFSSVGIVFKGSGFYRTDSRARGDNGSGDSASKAESSSESSSSSSSESGSGSKPAAKSGSSSNGAASSSSSSSSASTAAS